MRKTKMDEVVVFVLALSGLTLVIRYEFFRTSAGILNDLVSAPWAKQLTHLVVAVLSKY